MSELIGLSGLILGLVLLIVLTMRGMNLFISAPLCALLVAVSNQITLLGSETDFVTYYMSGFTGFIASWFFMFLLGSLFGKFMEDTGLADSVANAIVSKMGMQKAVFAVVAACAILTYGGVNLFVVAFSVYPMALSLFKDANLPRRFIPAVLAFGSVTFTMTSAGSPEIQNWIPIKYLGTTPYAGWEVSLLVAIFMAVFGYWWLKKMIAQAVANGEVFDARAGDPQCAAGQEPHRALPHPALGLVPLLVVLTLSFLLHDQFGHKALILALGGGVLSILLLCMKHFKNLNQAINEGTTGSLIALGNTAAVVGFGAVVKNTEAFQVAVDYMTQLPGNELVGASVAVSAIAGLTGSASGGQAIALPLLAPHYLEQGVDPEQLHRVVAISSGALDTLPHNGYVVTTIRAICRETHASAYWPMFAMTGVVPLLGLMLAVSLFTLF